MKKSVVSQSIPTTPVSVCDPPHVAQANFHAHTKHGDSPLVARRPRPLESAMREAYERVAPECEGITSDRMLPLNVDIDRSVGVVHEALPKVLAERDQIVKLPGFEARNIDRLGDYTLALWYIDQISQTSHEIVEPLSTLADDTLRARTELLAHAQSLVAAGIIAAEDLDSIGKSRAHVAIANDVLRLVFIYRGVWPRLAGRTLVTVEKLDAASQFAERLALAAQHRDYAPAVISAPMRNRQQVYTLFRRAYDEVREAVGYLHRNDDQAEQILPSLYVHGTQYTAPKPATPEPAASGGSSAAATSGSSATTAVTAPPSPAEPGIPQDDPFPKT